MRRLLAAILAVALNIVPAAATTPYHPYKYAFQGIEPGGSTGPFGSGAATLTFVAATAQYCGVAVTCTVTPTPALTNNNLAVFDIECQDSTGADSPTLSTDNGTSSWTNGFATGLTFGGHYYMNMDYTLAVAGSPTTVTAHCGASNFVVAVLIREYHRTAGSWVFGGCATSCSTTTPGGASTVATASGETPTASVPALIIGIGWNNANISPWASCTNGDGTYTYRGEIGDVFNGTFSGAVDKIVSSASGSAYTPCITANMSTGWNAWGYWFK